MEESRETVGFVGLGKMGQPMCRHLVETGYPVTVHDLRPESMDALAELGARRADSPAQLASISSTIITMLPDSPTVETAILGQDGLAGSAKPGTVVIDMSSSYPTSTIKISRQLAEQGVIMLDAPVSGGVAGAAAGTLAIMVGGDEEAYQSRRPILEAMGKNVVYMGASGAGHSTKIINNFLSAASTLATTEAMVLAAKLGLSQDRVLQAVQKSTGRNYSTDFKFPKYVLPRTFNAGFAMGLFHKDLEMFTALGRELKSPMLMGSLVHQYFQLGLSRYGFGADHLELVRMLEEWAGAEIKGDDFQERQS